MFSLDPFQIAVTAVVILFVLTVHEFSHALVADALGDKTARRMGRLTLNPLAHLDLLGTVLMFIAGFGWAKPVPVDLRNLKNPKTEMIYIAAAGPLSNILTAVVVGAAFQFLAGGGAEGVLPSNILGFIANFLLLIIVYSVALAVFNLIPIPPLDGSRILYGVLPHAAANFYARFEKFGMLLLFGIFIFAGESVMRVLWTPVKQLVILFTGESGIF
ncbi:site-2 protease family protein [Candidatus Mycalebacterium sp.]